MIGGDDGLARRRMRTHLEAEAAFLRRRRSARQVLDPSVAMAGPAGNKGAEQVARSIFRDIVARNLPEPGTLLGSEAELTAKYEVSRAVFREAVRILEHHQIATMRRGPGGGLFVVAAERGGGHRCGRDLSRARRGVDVKAPHRGARSVSSSR